MNYNLKLLFVFTVLMSTSFAYRVDIDNINIQFIKSESFDKNIKLFSPHMPEEFVACNSQESEQCSIKKENIQKEKIFYIKSCDTSNSQCNLFAIALDEQTLIDADFQAVMPVVDSNFEHEFPIYYGIKEIGGSYVQFHHEEIRYQDNEDKIVIQGSVQVS